MSKKKLTADEKRNLLLKLIQDKKDVFQLKELEKIASKEKGIVLQTVKDILKSLVDDNLVEQEKIGTSQYFWSFKNKELCLKKMELQNLEKKLMENKKKLQEIKNKLSLVDQDEIKIKESKINELKQIKDEIKKLNTQFDDQNIVEELKDLKEETNLCTENIFLIKSFVKNKFNLDEKMLDKQFGIPDDLDYIE